MAFKRLAFSKWEDGQTLLIVVLVMVVIFTIALSIAARNVTNERVSTEEANSQAALAAAEAGIDTALSTGVSVPSRTIGNAILKSAVPVDIGGSKFQLKGSSGTLDPDQGVDIWLVDHNPDGTLPDDAPMAGPTTFTFYWGDPAKSDCSTQAIAAIELIVISSTTTSKTTAIAKRYLFDPCNRVSLHGAPADGYYSSTPAIGDPNLPINSQNYLYKTSAATISVSSGWLIRLVPLYASTIAAVVAKDGSNNPVSLPKQGTNVTSVGQAGNAQRKVTAFQGYPQLANEFFPYVLFCTPGSNAAACQ